MPDPVKAEILKWTRGHVEPSAPHQEEQPWLGWFRPLDHNNHVWVDAWPELEV